MTPNTSGELKALGRDLLLLLGLPALLLGGLLLWWHPWGHHRMAIDRYVEAEEAARDDFAQLAPWRGFHIKAPDDFVVLHTGHGVEVLEAYPDERDGRTWASRLAFFPLTPDDNRRFRDQALNCDLAPGRCWTDSLAGTAVECQRSAGVPDPAVWWTPHITCIIPALGIRYLVNAPDEGIPTLHEVITATLGSRQHEALDSMNRAALLVPGRPR